MNRTGNKPTTTHTQISVFISTLHRQQKPSPARQTGRLIGSALFHMFRLHAPSNPLMAMRTGFTARNHMNDFGQRFMARATAQSHVFFAHTFTSQHQANRCGRELGFHALTDLAAHPGDDEKAQNHSPCSIVLYRGNKASNRPVGYRRSHRQERTPIADGTIPLHYCTDRPLIV